MRHLVAIPILVVASGAYAAPGPSISPPDQTQGVMERQLETPRANTSGRPLPKPMDATAVMTKAEHNTEVASGFPLPFWAGQNDFVLPAATDPAFLRTVALGELVSRDSYALDLSVPIVYAKRGVSFEPSESALLASAEPEDVMKSEIMRILSDSYDMNVVDGDGGYEQLLDMAEGRTDDAPAAMISPDSYEFPAEQVAEAEDTNPVDLQTSPTGLVMGMDPAAAILNSLSQQQVAAMSPDQISALVMAAHGRPMNVKPPLQQQYVAPLQPVAHSVMAGIPSLDYRGEELPEPQVISAADVPAGSTPFSEPSVILASAAQAQEPIHVGNGENILLKGWKLGLTGSGGIGMYMNGDPGSIIEISEGMVVGPLGAVEKITMEQGNIIARFSSGEVMTSPAALVNMASL